MRVFRYFDAAGGLATLKTRQLRLADPSKFNDPFELTPRAEELTEEQILRRLSSESRINDFFNTDGRAKGLTEAQSRQEYLDHRIPTLIKKIIDGKSERIKKWRLELLPRFSMRFRVLCCSQTHESILMWSHYAEKHRGMVIEIETGELQLGLDLDPHIFEVRYRTSPPLMSALTENVEQFTASIDEVLSTKAIQWSYEEEIRIQFPTVPSFKNGDHYELQFDPRCVKRVILGWCAEPWLYRDIEQLAEHPDYQHAQFQNALGHPHDYKLLFADRSSEK